MAIKGEQIRQAKKFLENNKLSISIIKPRLFAQASEQLGKSFNETLLELKSKIYGKTDSSNKETN
jgi:hypothetical protein